MRLVRPEPATQLAALRIVVPAMILLTPELRHAAALAGDPAGLRIAPEGLGWFVAWMPIGPIQAGVLQGVAVFSALCAIAGVRARLSLAVLAVSSFYLFSLSQLSGAVWHDMHLLWMTALLAASPCDEALAFDRRGQSPPVDSVRYGWPLTLARLQLAAIYFFPGLHKMLTSGLAWALSDNLRNQLWWKWAEHGMQPGLRVDHVPWLLHAGALYVLAFELSFPLLALVPRTRPYAAVAGLGFHLLGAYFLRIPFVSLWATYVVLVDPTVVFRRGIATWASLRLVSLRSLGSAPQPSGPVASWRERGRSLQATHPETASAGGTLDAGMVATRVVGIALLFAIVVQGARGQTRAYPFACYPTFEFMAPTTMPDLRIEVQTPTGSWVIAPHARDARGYRSQRQWGEIWSLAGVTSPVDPQRLRRYLEANAQHEPARSLVARAVRARFTRVYLSVVPEQRGEPPLETVPLADIPLGS